MYAILRDFSLELHVLFFYFLNCGCFPLFPFFFFSLSWTFPLIYVNVLKCHGSLESYYNIKGLRQVSYIQRVLRLRLGEKLDFTHRAQHPWRSTTSDTLICLQLRWWFRVIIFNLANYHVFNLRSYSPRCDSYLW